MINHKSTILIMKTLIIVILICFTNYLGAQNPLDTIYANEHMNVALFFPKPIRQAITGNDHFVFTYNRETPQYFGVLQGRSGTDSNLLTITDDGRVYAYLLKYQKHLTKLNYFLNQENSIGNETPLDIKPQIDTDSLTEKLKKEGTYKRYCEYLLGLKHETIAVKRTQGMVLKLLKVAYYQDETYLVLEVKNKSGIDFEVDDVRVSVVQGTKKRRASMQRLEREVIYDWGVPKIIRNKEAERFVLMMPKLVLEKYSKLQIEIFELNESVKVKLSLA